MRKRRLNLKIVTNSKPVSLPKKESKKVVKKSGCGCSRRGKKG